MQQGDILTSDLLLGIKREHSDHRDWAEMSSTGKMVCWAGDGKDPLDWNIEFKCETCNQLVQELSVDDIDLIRAVLKQNGVI